MRPFLVLGTLATLLALGGSLPPKDKDKDKGKGDDYDPDQDHGYGHGNDYGSNHDHANSKPESRSGFHIADYNPLNLLFTRQPSPGCDDYSAGHCGCFCHYQGYPYYICAQDHCQCYGAYVTGCWYAYYYYIGGGYPAPGEWHQPRYPHCLRYPYCSESPYSSVTPTYVSDGPTSTSVYDFSTPYESGSSSVYSSGSSSVYSSSTPYPSSPSSEYPSSTPYASSSSEYASSTPYQSSSEYPSTTAYVTSSEYYSSAEYTSTAIQGPSPSSS
ncbi:hypothetical protein BJX62DRAFT_251365 [Aspergillus germanicus]